LFKIFSKLCSFQAEYENVKRWAAPLQRIADILQPDETKTSESVRHELQQYLDEVQRNFRDEGDGPLVKNLLSYTKGFWKGLFTCYDHPHLPRTNNDLERFFRRTKARHRRMTGLRSWNEYILRFGEYVVLVDDALQESNPTERLQQVSYEAYRNECERWAKRLKQCKRRKQFRRNPQAYLQEVEEKLVR